MRLVSLLTLACSVVVAGALHAREALLHLPLNEGVGEVVRDPSHPAVAGVTRGEEWTQEVPAGFAYGSAWRSRGGQGAAVTVPAVQVAELANLESFTITCWLNVREARHLGRIASKASTRMDSFFDLRFDQAPNGKVAVVLSLRTGKIGRNGYPERNFEISSEAMHLPDGWFFLAVTRDSTTGKVDFYLGQGADQPLRLVGSGRGPLGALGTDGMDLMIGNVRANMKRAAIADFSDFRIYGSVLTQDEAAQVRAESMAQ